MNLKNSNLILICGRPQSGKSTAGEILECLTGKRSGTCSDAIYADLSGIMDVSEGFIRDMPKETIRHLLVAHGDYMTESDKGALVRHLYEEMQVNIVCGVRRAEELKAAKQMEPTAISLWIDRKDIPEIKDNTEIEKWMCDVVIDNNGTIRELTKNITQLL